MTISLYGIPTCDTCRKARAWLTERGLAYRWVDLRDSPPAPERIRAWVAALTAKALRNTSGASFRALGPEKDGWDDSRWAEELARDPMLVKRPVLEIDGEARAVGFKPEAWARLASLAG